MPRSLRSWGYRDIAGAEVPMAQRPDTRAMFVHLRRYIAAERLGNVSYADAIAGVIIELRSVIHSDESSSLCELYGPLGSLERLAQERYECISDEEATRSWNRRWRLALAQAGAFVDKVLAVAPRSVMPV